MTPAQRTERALRSACLEACRQYADAVTQGQGEHGDGMMKRARMAIAAKEWRRAERDAATP